MTAAASLQSVEKQYPDFHLGPLSLDLEAGRVRALIGPNGAGKTTAMDILAGLLPPTAGGIQLFGREVTMHDPRWKAEVGYASEQQPFYDNWSARQNLSFLAQFFPRWSVEVQTRLASRFDLPLGKKVATLSKGNRVKLALLAALARRPRILLLDEPTAGLDPLVRAEVLDTLWEYLAEDGPTILYSTHILSDLGRLADDLTFIRNGKLLLECQRQDLEDDWRRLTFRFEVGELPEEVRRSLIDHETQGSLHAAVTHDYSRALDQLRALGATQIEAQRVPLEDVAVQVLRASPATVASWTRAAGTHALPSASVTDDASRHGASYPRGSSHA